MSRLIDVDTLIAELMKHIWDDKKFSEIVKDVPTIHAIPIDEVKNVRDEITELEKIPMIYSTSINEDIYKVGKMLDKLIKESENT